MSPAKSFRDLKVCQSAREGIRLVFKLTKMFPREERYALVDQIRRRSRAVKAMIAEAWARRRYKAAFINKIDEALGETHETQSWLDDALDSEYLTKDIFSDLDRRYNAIGAMLSRMIDGADDFVSTIRAPIIDLSLAKKTNLCSPITDHRSHMESSHLSPLTFH